MRIAVTRPQPDGDRTAQALRARGHDVLLAPLMRIEPVAADLSGEWRGVIITSASALRAIRPAPLAALPVYAVGTRSADAAREAGFAEVNVADGDAQALVRLIAGREGGNGAPLLWLAGEDRAADLVQALAAHGIAAVLRVVYRAAAAPFPDELAAALRRGAVDAVLHFSKRTAALFVSGANSAGAAREVMHYCLSAQVAVPLRAAGASRIAVASRPDEAALIELLPPAAG